MLVDSHCHLDRLENKSLDKVLQHAASMDVNYFLCPSVELESFASILQLAKAHKNIVVAVGKHPTEIGHNPTVQELVALGKDPLVVGVGETGLDYFYCKTDADRAIQIELLKIHIRAARELHKPLIIHLRDAADDLLAILRAENAQEVGGVLHCFTDKLEVAQAALDLNFYISFSGIVTFKNAENLRHVAKTVPLERILVETDSPYLAPVPMRGKPNEPAYVRYVAEFLANLRGIPYAEFASLTTANFFRLFA